MKTTYDEFENGVRIMQERLSDGSDVYSVRVCGRDADTSFVEFSCEDYTHASDLAHEMSRCVSVVMELEIHG
jgi:hypothetical protein